MTCCTDDNPCGRCERAIDAIVDARDGHPWDYSQDELDQAADDAAERMCGF